MIIQRSRLTVFILAFGLISSALAMVILPTATPLTAQTQGTAAVTPAATAAGTPTLDPALILNQANLALTQAQAALGQSQGVLTQAAQVGSQAGIVLNFIQVVAILGSVFAALGGVLFAVSGLRTLNSYQADLDKSHNELETVRKDLAAATTEAASISQRLEAANANQVQSLKEEATRAYRSLGLLQLGEQQFALGNSKAALKMYQQAYDLNPGNEIVNYFLGEMYLIERDLPEAVKYLTQSIDLGKEVSSAYAALGLARRLQADSEKASISSEQYNQIYAEAEKLLLQAVGMNPGVRDINNESAYSTLAGLYRRQGRLREALNFYLKATEYTPNSTYPLGNVAQLYYQDGDLAHARDYYQRVLDVAIPKLMLTPHDIWLRLDVITAELATGQVDAANKMIDVLVAQTPSLGQLETGLGGLHMLKKADPPPAGIDEAIARFEKALTDRAVSTEPVKAS